MPDTNTADALPAPPWMGPATTRRQRPRGVTLDRTRIVAEALRLIDANGVEALTIRRLADGLGVTPMSLYWHVAGKDELLELVGHAVLAEIELPGARGDWRDQLRDIHGAMFAVVLRHPNTADVLAGRARYGAGGLRLFERILSVLLGAGLSPEAAFDAYQSLYLFTLGFMVTANRGPEFRAGQAQGIAYLASLPETRFPAIHAVVPVIGRRTLDQQFGIALDVVIEGIAARIA
jgi:AcrR family transcriptional regulator